MVDQRLDGFEVRGGLLGIEVAHGAEHVPGQGCGRKRGADDEFRAGWVCLGIGVVYLPAGLLLGAFFVDVVNDANDAGAIAAGVEHVPDGVAVGPIGQSCQVMGQSLVDHHDILAFRPVIPGEVAAADSGAHGAQIAGRDDVDEGRARALVGRLDALGPGHAPGAILAEGQVVGETGSFDAGNGADACDHFLEDGAALLSAQRTVFISRHAVVVFHLHCGGALGLEAEIDIEDVEKAAQQQARADQQHTGQRDLGDNKDGADAVVLAALSRAEAGVFERLVQAAAGHAKSRNKSEEYGGGDGDEERPRESRAVDAQGT